jgi:hypothetical protein
MPAYNPPSAPVQTNTTTAVPPPDRNGPPDRPRTAAEIGKALTAPFKLSMLGWKPLSVKDGRALVAPYVSGCDVQNRLDQVFGIGNWQDAYRVLAGGCVVCRLSLRIEGEWLAKVDVGNPSEQPDDGNRMKAAFSDALKRARLKWGIARYLAYVTPARADYDAKARQIGAPPPLPPWALPEPTPAAGPEGSAR